MKWYAVAHPGLEPVVVRELEGLGVHGAPVPGGVRFDATPEMGAALLPRLRTPSRLLVELVSGPARSGDELVGLVRRVQWKSWLLPDTRLDVHATAKGSRLHFTDSLEKKVAWLVREALKGPRVVERTPRATLEQRISIRLEADVATVSLDAGGELLHVRGWRTEQGPAPLRENLAACLLVAAGWNGEEPLLDPFCGAGTIPIEAALLAAGRSPYKRRFAAEEWPGVRLKPGGKAGGKAVAAAISVPIVGSDRDARVLGAAQGNAQRAGVEVAWRRLDIADVEPPPGVGLIVTNPPWGRRLGEGSEGRVWADFGRVLRERFVGWRVLFLAPDPQAASRVDRSARRLLDFSNGGVHVGAYAVEIT